MSSKQLLQHSALLMDIRALQHARRSEEDQFLEWFCSRYFGDKTSGATFQITNGKGDAGIDAVVELSSDSYSDTKTIFLIHCTYSKAALSAAYRKRLLGKQQYLEFASIVNAFNSTDTLRDWISTGCAPANKARYTSLLRDEQKHLHKLEFMSVSLLERSGTLEKRALALTAHANHPISRHSFYHRPDIYELFQRSLYGAVPIAKSITFRIEPRSEFHYNNPEEAHHAHPVQSFTMIAYLQDLIEAVKTSGDGFFAENVRAYQGRTQVNNRILRTFSSEPAYFFLGHNGITIIADEAERTTPTSFRLLNPSIINGSQTLHTLSAYAEPRPQARVLLRLFVISALREDRYSLISKLIERTNSQNAVKPWDLRSNDVSQVRLANDFARFRLYYERKSKTWTSTPYLRDLYTDRIEMVKTAQILGVAEFGAVAALNKGNLFSGSTYELLFTANYDFRNIFFKIALFRVIDLAFRRIHDEDVNPRDSLWYVYWTTWRLASGSDAFQRLRADGGHIRKLFESANTATNVHVQIERFYKRLRKDYRKYAADGTWNNAFKSSEAISKLTKDLTDYDVQPLRQALLLFASTINPSPNL